MVQDQTFWDSARRRMCSDRRRINLNAGTLSPTPIPVFDAVTALRRQMAENPSDFYWRQMPGLLDRSRAALAEYLHASPADLFLLPNTTIALNVLAASLKLPAGSEILTTDHEYGATMILWQHLAEARGWTLRKVPIPHTAEDPAALVGALQREIGAQTRVLFFSHVTCTTGLVLPVKSLCDAARQRGCMSIIDGAHAPGMVPVDLSDIGADAYVGNCHKWMMAPSSAGFLHVATAHHAMLEPLVYTWGAAYDPARADEDSRQGGTRRQWSLEFNGTTDRTPQMVIPHCLDFRASLGGDAAISARMRNLSAYARTSLAAIGLTCATPENPALHGGGMTAFDFPCDDPIAVRDYFWFKHGIECPVTAASERKFLRVSTGWFNTHEEIDRLVLAIKGWQERPPCEYAR
jgi:isopenicillin-N epimerase